MSGNKKIVKNTFFLYMRMLFNMAVSLYTSRIIIQTLGIEDFGIYTLVGGIVVLFSFLNNAMSGASQRFINIEIATGLKHRINKVFCMGINTHILISVIVLILSETIGLWFFNNKLNIPEARREAASIIYQLSILTTLFGILRIPYNAIILAYERMVFYAYLGILETILKLAIVFALQFLGGYDHLIMFGLLTLSVVGLVNLLYYIYCKFKFAEETKFVFYKDKKLFRELTSFSGWSLFGQMANVGSTQGLNMIMNIFIGVSVNAAMGIANQINAAIFNFISSFQVAFNPQVIQSYANNNLERHKQLILRASKYSFFLISILAVPFLIFTEFILKLWLGSNFPTYVVGFTQVVILISIIDALAGPFWMSASAIGNIRNYQIGVSLIIFINIPIAYVIIKLGYPPVYALLAKLLINMLTLGYRILYVYRRIHFEKSDLYSFALSILPVLCFLFFITLFYGDHFQNGWYSFFTTTILIEVALIIIILFFGLRNNEFKELISFCKSKISKNV